MIEIYPDLFIGSQTDLIFVDSGINMIQPGWFVISAAKDPWHREVVGYSTPGAPKDSPEYLFAERERRLVLNLVDAPDPAFVRDELVTKALDTIDAEINAGNKVLMHCNQGQSRAPTLALLWLRFHCEVTRPFLKQMTFDQAMDGMRERYPNYAPGAGMEGYARSVWEGE